MRRSFSLLASNQMRRRQNKMKIEMELNHDRVPKPVEHFLRYVNQGHHAGGSFYRTVRPDNRPDVSVKIEVIRGGVISDK